MCPHSSLHTALSCLYPLEITFSLLWCSQCSFITYSHLCQLVGLEGDGKKSDALIPPPPCKLREQTSPRHMPKDGLGWSREANGTLSPSLFAQSSFWLPFLPFNLSGCFHPGCLLLLVSSSLRLPANPSKIVFFKPMPAQMSPKPSSDASEGCRTWREQPSSPSLNIALGFGWVCQAAVHYLKNFNAMLFQGAQTMDFHVKF